jgi:hypothetical protein
MLKEQAALRAAISAEHHIRGDGIARRPVQPEEVGGAMALMEIAVGAAVGAVAGAVVGWPGLYLQRRMKRTDDVYARAMAGATAAWEAAHRADMALGHSSGTRGPRWGGSSTSWLTSLGTKSPSRP